MRIVSENTPEDIARNRASEEIRSALIDLAANIIRVTRGAGRPVDLDIQAQRFLQAVYDYKDTTGNLPSPLIYGLALSLGSEAEDFARPWPDELRTEIRAKEAIVRGALQMAASQLLGQRPIWHKGSSDVSDAVHRLHDIYDARRRKMRAEIRAASSSSKKTKRGPAKQREPIVF